MKKRRKSRDKTNHAIASAAFPQGLHKMPREIHRRKVIDFKNFSMRNVVCLYEGTDLRDPCIVDNQINRGTQCGDRGADCSQCFAIEQIDLNPCLQFIVGQPRHVNIEQNRVIPALL